MNQLSAQILFSINRYLSDQDLKNLCQAFPKLKEREDFWQILYLNRFGSLTLQNGWFTQYQRKIQTIDIYYLSESRGQLKKKPLKIDVSGFVEISVGEYSFIGLNVDRNIFLVDLNPNKITPLNLKAKQAVMTYNFILALDFKNQVWAKGHMFNFGDSCLDDFTLVPFFKDKKIIKIAMHYINSLFLDEKGKVWEVIYQGSDLKSDEEDEITDGFPYPGLARLVFTGAKDIFVSDLFYLIDQEGNVWWWGKGSYGKTFQYEPIMFKELKNIISLSTSYQTLLALDKENQAWIYDYDYNRLVLNKDPIENIIQVQHFRSTSLFLTKKGEVLALGELPVGTNVEEMQHFIVKILDLPLIKKIHTNYYGIFFLA